MSYKLVILSLVGLHALTASALPPCVCTRNLQPVCGSDGQTYSNYCLLDCQKYKTGRELTVKKEGPCEGLEQNCICTFEYKPVCGNDGNTYPNRCALLCKRSALPDIDVVSEGACSDEVKVPQPLCICSEEVDYVCGSDGNTYRNPCQLNCATANNPSLSIKSHSICEDKVKVVDLPSLPQVPPCICTEELNEVCGSDGTTYANPCLLNCATAQNPSLSIKSYRRCENGVNVANNPSLPQVPPCICTDDLNEVCGSDGKTYGNPCLLNCATAKNPSLSVKNHGKCDNVNVVNPIQGDQPSSCACPRNMKPVCGSDGITYNNECLLICAGSQVSLARMGPCGF